MEDQQEKQRKQEEEEETRNEFEDRKRYYEHEVMKNPHDDDLWFGYIWLLQQHEEEEEEESEGKDHRTKIREVYERAIANVPGTGNERLWESYLRLCISYAVYEELDARDVQRARHVYLHCLRQIPNDKFFAGIWLLAAKFEIRQLNLEGAREILDAAICKVRGTEILLNKYIKMEQQLGNVDRCRNIYKKYISLSPQDCVAWIRFAMLEAHQGYRGGKNSATQEERKHCIQRARMVFERAINYFTTLSATCPLANLDICTLQDVWEYIEASFGVLGDVNLIRSRYPKKAKRDR
ncbi:hypothetical protein ACLB2K_070621 [Fragaria x ananassa]